MLIPSSAGETPLARSGEGGGLLILVLLYNSRSQPSYHIPVGVGMGDGWVVENRWRALFLKPEFLKTFPTHPIFKAVLFQPSTRMKSTDYSTYPMRLLTPILLFAVNSAVYASPQLDQRQQYNPSSTGMGGQVGVHRASHI